MLELSVIIPVYNTSEYLTECIDSVLAQTYQSFEAILVDDGSTDDSGVICDHYLKVDQRVKVIHKANGGLSDARNVGINCATGKYLFFLDSDDLITTDCLSSLVELCQKYPGVDIVQGNIHSCAKRWENWLDITDKSFPEYTENPHWISKHLMSDIPMTSWNKLIRRQLITDNNLYFPKGLIHEDEFWRFISFDKITSIAFCLTPTYDYRDTPGSISQSSFYDKKFNAYLQVALTAIQDGRVHYCLTSLHFLLSYLLRLDNHKLVGVERPDEYRKKRNSVITELLSINIPRRWKLLLAWCRRYEYGIKEARFAKILYLREYLLTRAK